MDTKHMKGLNEDLKRQKGSSSPSDALKKMKSRPAGDYHGNARRKYSPEYEENLAKLFNKK